MMSNHTSKFAPLVAALLLALHSAPLLSGTAEELMAYSNATLLCKDQASGAVCHLWLESNGRYFVYYDRGVQQVMPVAGGNFRLEGRRGTFQLRGSGEQRELCLTPDAAPGKIFQIEQAGLLYAGSGCYPFVLHQPGETWQQNDKGGKPYQLWLVPGRG